MASLVNVKDLYNSIALATGFPLYTNETDTPNTTQFLLEVINEALHSLIDELNTNANILQRENRIVTVPGQQMYPVNGVVRNIQITDKKGRIYPINYLDRTNFLMKTQSSTPQGMPRGYAINKGYIKLYPIPDDAYNIDVTISIKDLVLSNNDTFRNTVQTVDDSIMCDQEFAVLIKLRAMVLIYMRCASPLTNIYNQICQKRFLTYQEHDYGSNEAQRGPWRDGGHYNSERGLLG